MGQRNSKNKSPRQLETGDFDKVLTYYKLATLLIGLASVALATAQLTEFRTLANNLAEGIAASGKRSIAVVDFTDLQGNPTELGRYVAEELSVAMARSNKGFEVIDRAHLKTILNEHKLTASGLIDPATAKKLGQIVGADALLTGSITPFSESVHVTIKVIVTDTARIIAAETIDLPKTPTIAELLGNGLGTIKDGRPRGDRPTGTGPVSGILVTAPAGPPITSPVVVSAQFQYELVECQGMATSVRCNMRITNHGTDRRLIHYCGTSQTKADRKS